MIIICNFISLKVKKKIKSSDIDRVFTIYKEPINEYKGVPIIFIDDFLTEEDYLFIDKKVEKTINKLECKEYNILPIDNFNIFDYIKTIFKREYAKYLKQEFLFKKASTNKNSLITINVDHKFKLFINENNSQSSTNEKEISIKNIFKKMFSLMNKYDFFELFNKKQKTFQKKIIFMGNRSFYIPLLKKINEDFNICVYDFDYIRKLKLIKAGIQFETLRIPDINIKKIKRLYDKLMFEISNIIGINILFLKEVVEFNLFEKIYLTYKLLVFNNITNDYILYVEQSIYGKERLAVDYFNRNNYKSLELLHGVPSSVEVGETTKVAIFGERDYNYLSSNGISSDKLSITGNPNFIKYYKKNYNLKKEYLLLILDWIKFLPSKRSNYENYKQITLILELLKKFKNEKLVIKLHPSQSLSEEKYIKNIINHYNLEKRVEIKRKEDILEVLKNAKIVYNNNSTVGVEAMLLEKDLIILDFFSHRKIEYEKFNACYIVKNYDELIKKTRSVLSEKSSIKKRNYNQTKSYFNKYNGMDCINKIVKDLNSLTED